MAKGGVFPKQIEYVLGESYGLVSGPIVGDSIRQNIIIRIIYRWCFKIVSIKRNLRQKEYKSRTMIKSVFETSS